MRGGVIKKKRDKGRKPADPPAKYRPQDGRRGRCSGMAGAEPPPPALTVVGGVDTSAPGYWPPCLAPPQGTDGAEPAVVPARERLPGPSATQPPPSPHRSPPKPAVPPWFIFTAALLPPPACNCGGSQPVWWGWGWGRGFSLSKLLYGSDAAAVPLIALHTSKFQYNSGVFPGFSTLELLSR